MRNRVSFFLNGKRVDAGAEQAKLMLSDYLRYEKNLTGTKVVCAEGDCGACSVLKLDSNQQFVPVNACIIPVAQLDGSSVVTVDALAIDSETPHPKLSPVQSAMVNCHGSQCGFCTPGFVVALTGAIEKKKCQSKKTESRLTLQEAKNALTGNLCRCTGYQPILDAAVSVDANQYTLIKSRFYSKAQDAELNKIRSKSALIEGEQFSIFAPKTLNEAVRYLSRHADARLIGGSTDLGVLSNKGKLKFETLLSLHLVKELEVIKKIKSGRIQVGARVTLTDLRNHLKKTIPEFSSFLDLFASPQIKNIATLIGNVGNASPIADTPPFLLVSSAVVNLVSAKGKRKVPLEQFYLGYRKTALKRGELIASIEFDLPKKSSSLALYKTSQRKDLDISIVNAAFLATWKKSKADQPKTLDTIRIAMGGIAATPLRLNKTETVLKGAVLTDDVLKKAVQTLHSEMTPLSDLRGSSSYRRIVVENLFMKFMREHG